MTERLDKHILKNGMVILGEPMDSVESAAFEFMLPVGAAMLPQGCCGAANVIADWIFRGAGNLNSKKLCGALDGLGLHRASDVSSAHITIGAVMEASSLLEALDLYGDIILRPHLKNNEFKPAKLLATEGIMALEDDPRQKVMVKLREQFYPDPLGRSDIGSIEELKTLTAEKTKRLIEENLNFSHVIFTIAGKYDFNKVAQKIESLFETGQQKPLEALKIGSRGGQYTHIQNDGAQVHIGLMTKTIGPADENFYNVGVAVSILSGGMSSRLFTEVREKRGLCYAVRAKYHCLKQAAGIICYAGTTPDKAQETIDVIIAEFNRLAEAISEDEILRAKAGLKASLILQSESSSSRASGIGGDYYMLGRVRSLDEIKEKIEQTSVDSVLTFLRNNRFKDFTAVTIGPKEITLK